MQSDLSSIFLFAFCFSAFFQIGLDFAFPGARFIFLMFAGAFRPCSRGIRVLNRLRREDFKGVAGYGNGYIGLGNADTENRVTKEMLLGMWELTHKYLRNPIRRAIVMRGSPEYFCKGVLIEDMLHDKAHYEDFCRYVYFVNRTIKPYITFLDGKVEDAGVGLGLTSYYAVSTDSTAISFPITKYGLIPGGGSTHFMAKGHGGYPMALATGERVAGESVYLCGMARLFSKYDRGEILGQLFMNASADEEGAKHAIAMMCEVPEYTEKYSRELQRINDLYETPSIEETLYRLRSAGKHKRADDILSRPPLTLKVIVVLLLCTN